MMVPVLIIPFLRCSNHVEPNSLHSLCLCQLGILFVMRYRIRQCLCHGGKPRGIGGHYFERLGEGYGVIHLGEWARAVTTYREHSEFSVMEFDNGKSNFIDFAFHAMKDRKSTR